MPLTYRQAEASMIARYVRAGDSCSVVGVSGMGKSNLFRHLRHAHTRQHYFGDNWQKYLFLNADSHALGELSERAVYDLLLGCLTAEAQQHNSEASAASRIEEIHQQVRASTDPLLWQRSFVQAVRSLMETDGARRLVIFFDQFDDIYKTVNPRFFTTLRSVRDDFKYRISYLVLTREELPYMCNGSEYEEFYELFSANVLGLGPYHHDDALLLLAQINERYEQSLPAETSEHLIALTGGHPGLLKASYMALLNGFASLSEDEGEAVGALLEVNDVTNECAKLWNSITAKEQTALVNFAVGDTRGAQDSETNRRLLLKRLVQNQNGSLRPFCPVFSRYAAQQQQPTHTVETKISAGPIRIDSAGEVWVHSEKVEQPLSKKELLLLEYLCLEPGRLRTKDEIIAVVYQNEYKMNYDDALNALVKRLRERLEEVSQGHNYILTVRGKGYRLNL